VTLLGATYLRINERHVTNLPHSPRRSAPHNCAVIGCVRRTADWLKMLQSDWFISIRVWRRIRYFVLYVPKLPKMWIYIGTGECTPYKWTIR